MQAQTLINEFIHFFEQQGHQRISAGPLASPPDDTTLFTSAGMQPLIPYLSGLPHPQGRRLVDVQPCIRTVDIDEVGDTTHLTFFEMLGNWSLGDYFKPESIRMSYEFLTKYLDIDRQRLWVTVFSGDESAPPDDVSPEIWRKVGIPTERIVPLGRADNWWGPVGNTGPCGPDTEIFFDVGRPSCGIHCQPGCSCGRFIEIWNNVFMEYDRTVDGRDHLLPQQGVDTGMGVDRVIAVIQRHDSVFDTELFQPLMGQLPSEISDNDTLSRRIVVDHIKAATMIIGEGTKPGNKRQGYVVRRLIRRAVDHGRRLKMEPGFIRELAKTVIGMYQTRYPHLIPQRNEILNTLQLEESSFNKTIERGQRVFQKQIKQVKETKQDTLSGKTVFHLFDTYGIPPELTEEWATEQDLKVDHSGFDIALAEHREISGGGKQGEFAGGLASRDSKTVQLHTATHLLHQALRDVLGPHVAQKGSHITPDRLRFDFSHPMKLTDEEQSQVEAQVNDQIQANLPVNWVEVDPGTARKMGAIGLFEDKYGDRVKVYSIGDYSREICGGPHVSRTGELGHFRIMREQSSGAGVRRIRAVVE
ncbi:MAG: alanine--tRNA ligase [Chloroflexota bacterium]